MNFPRVFTVIAGFAGWLYSWFVIRGVRNEYSAGDLGPMPLGVLIVLGLVSTSLIAAFVLAGTRSRAWPFLAIVSGPLLGVGTVLAQWFVMRHPLGSRASLSDAFTAALNSRSGLEITLFIAFIPTSLVLAGAAELLSRKRVMAGV